MDKFIFGMFAGAILLTVLVSESPTSYHNIVTKAISECEKSLPRDQHCKIIAVPQEKE